MPMAVADLLPSRYYAFAGAIAVTVLASMAALFDSRWLFLAGAAGAIRPEIRQYLLEGDSEAVPFSRAQRSLAYQRAKNVESRQPFGTGEDVAARLANSLTPARCSTFRQ
jgi:hypothetical protein